MARDNSYGKGNPVDPTSEEVIGQSLNYMLTSSGLIVPVSSTNPLPVKQVDVHPNYVVNQFIHRYTATATTLAAATTGDGTENTIEVASATGFSIGDYIHINTGLTESTHPKILNIVGTTFTLDRYLDFAYSIGDEVVQSIINLASSAGSLVTPVEYNVQPPSDQIWHIERLIFEMRHGAAGDLSKFGSIAALTNGCILRAKINGQYSTFTNWKTNGDIKADMYDVEFDDRAGGGGIYSTSGRGSFNRTGTVIKLDGATNDRIEFYVQDDITGLTGFTMKMQGHFEST